MRGVMTSEVYIKVLVDGVEMYQPRRVVVPNHTIGTSITFMDDYLQLYQGKVVGYDIKVKRILTQGFESAVTYTVEKLDGTILTIDQEQVEDL